MAEEGAGTTLKEIFFQSSFHRVTLITYALGYKPENFQSSFHRALEEKERMKILRIKTFNPLFIELATSNKYFSGFILTFNPLFIERKEITVCYR